MMRLSDEAREAWLALSSRPRAMSPEQFYFKHMYDPIPEDLARLVWTIRLRDLDLFMRVQKSSPTQQAAIEWARSVSAEEVLAMLAGELHAQGVFQGGSDGLQGRQLFLLLDTETGLVKARRVETGVIHFDESMVVLPFEKEDEFIRAKLASMIRTWNLDAAELPRVLCRLKLSGYTTDKKRLMKTVLEVCSSIRFYPAGEPDLSDVSVSSDPERAELAERVQRLIANMEWPSGPGAPQREAAFLLALHTIYDE